MYPDTHIEVDHKEGWRRVLYSLIEPIQRGIDEGNWEKALESIEELYQATGQAKLYAVTEVRRCEKCQVTPEECLGEG